MCVSPKTLPEFISTRREKINMRKENPIKNNDINNSRELKLKMTKM